MSPYNPLDFFELLCDAKTIDLIVEVTKQYLEHSTSDETSNTLSHQANEPR